MKGVQFIIDKRGNPTSVILDLAIWHEIWEDIYDIKAIEAARQEGGKPIAWEQIKAEMDAELAAEPNAAQAARRAVDRSFPPSRRATDWDYGALKRELAKITDEDRREMQAIADEGLEDDLKHWPEYDVMNGASAEPSPVPSFADRMEALCDQPPSRERAIERVDIIWADLNPVRGHEQGGRSPIVVISSERLNTASGATVIAMALTTRPQRLPFPFVLKLESSTSGRRSWVKLSQIRVLSHKPLGNKIGRVSDYELGLLVKGLNELIT